MKPEQPTSATPNSGRGRQTAVQQSAYAMPAAKPQWVWGTLVALLLFACAVAAFSMWVILHYHPN